MGKSLVCSLGHSLSFADLSLKGKANWPVLLSECDEQGRFLASPRNYKRSICPIVDEIVMEDVDGLLSELEEHRMVIRYSGDGHALGQVINWWVWNSPPWRKPSKYPPPDGWIDRIRIKKGKKIIMVNWDKEGGFPENNPLWDKDKDKDKESIKDTITIPYSSDAHPIKMPYSQIFTEVTAVLIATDVQAQEIDAWMEDVPEDWFRDACKEAVDNNVRKWTYVRAILERWSKEGKQKRGSYKRSRATDDLPYDQIAAERQAEREAAELDA